jgi:hypothetical protein
MLYCKSPCFGDVVKTLQAKPNCLCARLAIAFSPKEAPKFTNQTHCISQGWRIIWWNWIFSFVRDQGFPFTFREKHRTGDVGRFTTQFCQMKNTPRNYHVNSQTRFDPLCGAELSCLNFAAALQRPVIDFNSPSQTIPPDDLDCTFKTVDSACCQQHPFQWGHAGGGIDFFCNYGPYRQLVMFGFKLWRFQPHLCETNFKTSYSSFLKASTWNTTS